MSASKIVMEGRAYHINAGTVRTLVAHNAELAGALELALATINRLVAGNPAKRDSVGGTLGIAACALSKAVQS